MSLFSKVATFQGHMAFTLFSIYAVNPSPFIYYLGGDPGAFFFYNMLYGNGVHIYTRPAMKKLRFNMRLMYSIYGTYMFNTSAIFIFFALAEKYSHLESKIFPSILSFFIGKFMYSMFYSYLYFVDRSIFPDSRSSQSALDIIFNDD